jgi:hypothetical protein
MYEAAKTGAACAPRSRHLQDIGMHSLVCRDREIEREIEAAKTGAACAPRSGIHSVVCVRVSKCQNIHCMRAHRSRRLQDIGIHSLVCVERERARRQRQGLHALPTQAYVV